MRSEKSVSFCNLSCANAVQAARDPDEEGDYMAFEQLMAEAAIKKDKKGSKKDKKDEKEAKKEDGIPSHVKAESTAKTST